MARHIKDTKKYHYRIAYLLEDLPVGSTFEPSILHITILPRFALETNEQKFIEWFYRHFNSLTAFEAVASRRAMFGPDKDIPVIILEPQEKFMQLHKIALSWFGDVGARWAVTDPYVGDDYIAHISQRRGYVINETEKFHISSVTLFKANRHDDQVRTVAAKAILHEPN